MRHSSSTPHSQRTAACASCLGVLWLSAWLSGCQAGGESIASPDHTPCSGPPAVGEQRVELIDVGGFSLYADIQGAAAMGLPVVIFDAGAGETHEVWQSENVQQSIAAHALTLSYDRAGLGRSEASGRPATALEQALQLRRLLEQAELPPPYLLVSHSASGFSARVFADLYPQEVYGVVLVDSSHEDMTEGEWQLVTYVDVSSNPEITYAEFQQSAEQVRDTRTRDRLRHTPLSVLSATCHGNCTAGISIVDEEGWMEFQRDLVSLSYRGLHRIAPPGSEHHLMTTQPQMVIDGICEILAL